MLEFKVCCDDIFTAMWMRRIEMTSTKLTAIDSLSIIMFEHRSLPLHRLSLMQNYNMLL